MTKGYREEGNLYREESVIPGWGLGGRVTFRILAPPGRASVSSNDQAPPPCTYPWQSGKWPHRTARTKGREELEKVT